MYTRETGKESFMLSLQDFCLSLLFSLYCLAHFRSLISGPDLGALHYCFSPISERGQVKQPTQQTGLVSLGSNQMQTNGQTMLKDVIWKTARWSAEC